MDLFASKNLKPMLFYEGKLFNSEEYIYEIKFDGHRTIIYLDHNYINIRSRNNKDVTSLYPELNEVKKLVKRKCILDGELIDSCLIRMVFVIKLRFCILKKVRFSIF